MKSISENVSLSPRNLATILAALRYWQREGLMSSGHEQDIASDGDTIEPLAAIEIDALCERINRVMTCTDCGHTDIAESFQVPK